MFKNVRVIRGKKYHYLEHSFRVGKKVSKVSFYLPKNKKFDLNSFTKTNNEIISEIAKKRVEYIKENLLHDKFYEYGKQLEYLEETKILYQVFFKKLSLKEQDKIMDTFLRYFIVHSMEMEGGTISYEIAEAIDNNKKFDMKNINELDILLYKQLKEAYKELQNIRLRSPKQIRDLHKLIYNGIYSFAGKFRNEMVTFGRDGQFAQTASPEMIVSGYKKMFENYNKSKGKICEFDRIILFHRDYQQVHGFKDGNSRLGRLIMVKQFIGAEYPPLLVRGSSSESYRTTLVKAINANHTIPLFKFYYEQYKRTFERFWKPIIEEAINKEFNKM